MARYKLGIKGWEIAMAVSCFIGLFMFGSY